MVYLWSYDDECDCWWYHDGYEWYPDEEDDDFGDKLSYLDSDSDHEDED